MKKKNSIRQAVLLAAMLWCAGFTLLWGQEFAGGLGTEEDPWQIATAEHLDNVRNYPGSTHADKHFIQTADIDLGEAPWNEGNGWNPIGRVNNQFYGTYNGNGFSVINLTINLQDDIISRRGLFGVVKEAVLINVSLIDADITSSGYSGGLAGEIEDASVSGCFVSGTIRGYNSGGLAGAITRSNINMSGSDAAVYGWRFSGGLTGYLTQSTMNDSYSRGFVICEEDVIGGLSGHTRDSVINRSYSNSVVIGNRYVGGLVGSISSSRVNDSYSTGPVFGRDIVGGLAGDNARDSAIINCYSTSPVSTYRDGGGLIGINSGSTVTNSYWNIDSSGQSTSAAGEGRRAVEMTEEINFEGWDFDGVWMVDETRSYPYHSWQGEVQGHNRFQPYNLQVRQNNGEIYLYWEVLNSDDLESFNVYRDGDIIATTTNTGYMDINNLDMEEYEYMVSAIYPEGESAMSNILSVTHHSGFPAGEGTAHSPYHIETAEQLDLIRYNQYAHFRQTGDIDLKEISAENEDGWLPIGTFDYPFKGTYDGKDFSISNLYIMRPDYDTGFRQGLFGYTLGAELHNINLYNVDVIGEELVGGLVGFADNTFINGCFVEGFVWAISFDVGGIAGRSSYNSIIANCHTEGQIGLGWELLQGKRQLSLRPPHNIGASAVFPSAKRNSNVNNNELLHSDYGQFRVSAIQSSDEDNRQRAYAECTGGIVGINASSSLVIYCSSNALITGVGVVGGLVGANTREGKIVNSYSTGAVHGESYVGGLSGVNWGYITNSYSTGRVKDGIKFVGGLIGRGYEENVTASYWNIETAVQDSSMGGEGRTTAQMTFPHSADTYVGWDFEEVWKSDESYEFNNGYPYLRRVIDVVSIEQEPAASIERISILNYPNPFNPETTIQFSLPEANNIQLEIYNIKGQKIKTLHTGYVEAGRHSILWNGQDNKGSRTASGIYLYRLTTEDDALTGKMMMLK